jgi:hypothetical protein
MTVRWAQKDLVNVVCKDVRDIFPGRIAAWSSNALGHRRNAGSGMHCTTSMRRTTRGEGMEDDRDRNPHDVVQTSLAPAAMIWVNGLMQHMLVVHCPRYSVDP